MDFQKLAEALAECSWVKELQSKVNRDHLEVKLPDTDLTREMNIVIEATSPNGRFSGHFPNFSKSCGLVLKLFSVHICINY